MKLKDLRQKYNNLLQRFIRLFSLSSVAFVLTACYGCPYSEYEVQGDVYDEDGKPLQCMQVVVSTYDDFSYEMPDTVYTDKAGHYHVHYSVTSFGGDCVEVIVNDTTGNYDSQSKHIASKKMTVIEEDSWGGHYSMEADFLLKQKTENESNN